MEVADLRIALFSGNYNYVRDGANQALNRLVSYLLRQGAAVRVYAPLVEPAAFEHVGDLVGVPAVPIPFRTEYRMPMGISKEVQADLESFRPNVVHVSSPDVTGHRAVTWARGHGIPILASVHTRFETYPRYYKLGFTEPMLVSILRRFYRRCDALVAPSQSMVDVLREQGMSDDIGLWERGVDREVFDPARRDLAWRRELGIRDDDVAIGFLGRLVMEKGLDVFADAIRKLRFRDHPFRVLVVGDGPAREWFESSMPGATFAGFRGGRELGTAVASMDVLFNPSITETFGNVTLEAMASAIPVVAARATGSTSLVVDGKTGMLVEPGDTSGFANALAAYLADPALRKQHGAAGEERSRAYSWDAINQAVADTYLRLVERKPAAAAR